MAMDGTYTEVRNVSITVQFKYDTLAGAMNEQFRRRWAGCEALAMGRGGVSIVAAETGMSRNTVLRGIAEIQEQVMKRGHQPFPSVEWMVHSLNGP